MQEQIQSLKKTARNAGVLYLLMGITSFYAIMYVPSKLLVKGNAEATAKNIVTNEYLFRSGIVADLINAILSSLLAFTLYRLFKNINKKLARMLVTFVLLEIPIFFLLETFNITALKIIKGEVLNGFSKVQQSDIAFLFIKMYAYGTMALEIFFGLWLLPFGLLIIQSRFIPRIIGVLMLIAGFGYVMDSVTTLLIPQYSFITKPFAFTFSGLGELSTIAWLIFKGVKDTNATAAVSNAGVATDKTTTGSA